MRLTCLDDDAQGRPLSVLWERELGARVIRPAQGGLGTPRALDEPRRFAAYLHALKWSSVTATDARLFQAPFRAGIHLLDHQLSPLKKALELPRVNLFIADDVGLGKTIEAGLILMPLLAANRVRRLLILAPAKLVPQWRARMKPDAPPAAGSARPSDWLHPEHSWAGVRPGHPTAVRRGYGASHTGWPGSLRPDRPQRWLHGSHPRAGQCCRSELIG